MFMHDYNKTEGKLVCSYMYQKVLLQLLQLFGSDRPWAQILGVKKIRLAMGYQKASPPSQWFGPANLAAHWRANTENSLKKSCGLRMFLFFFWHIYFFNSRFPTDFGNKLYRNLLIFPPSSFTGNWCIFQSCLSSSCCGSSTNLESRRSCNSCDGSFGSGCPSLIILPWNLLTWNLKMMVSKRNFLFQGLLFSFHVKFRGL